MSGCAGRKVKGGRAMRGSFEEVPMRTDFRTDDFKPDVYYTWKVVKVEDRTTKTHGDPMPKLTLEVVGGELDGRKFTGQFTLSSNPNSPAYRARFVAQIFLKAIGKPHVGQNIEWDSDDWLFCVFKAKLKKKSRMSEFDRNPLEVDFTTSRAPDGLVFQAPEAPGGLGDISL